MSPPSKAIKSTLYSMSPTMLAWISAQMVTLMLTLVVAHLFTLMFTL